jgi:predicted transcriptional regulator
MSHTNELTERRAPSVLTTLRGLIPTRTLYFHESLRIAELQASRLLELRGVSQPGVPEGTVSDLPHVQVCYRRLPASGLTYWDAAQRTWVIGINASEPPTRQKFTLFHEYKHLVDHYASNQLYTGTPTQTASRQAERAADYFAACVLMPKRLIKAAYFSGLQTIDLLAERFEVSATAMSVRLAQLGVTRPADSDGTFSASASRTPSSLARHGYNQRALSSSWTAPIPTEVAA